jgi:hypothetical protein
MAAQSSTGHKWQLRAWGSTGPSQGPQDSTGHTKETWPQQEGGGW